MEMLFVSINRAINTYGANVRNLQAYVAYHKEEDAALDLSNPQELRQSNVSKLLKKTEELIGKVEALDKQYQDEAIKDNALDMVGKVDTRKSSLLFSN